MASDVEICNLAMNRLGQDPITSLADDSKRASLVNTSYARIRDEMLTGYVWGFARKRVNLAPNAIPPAFITDYSNAFDLPGDYLALESLGDYTQDYLIEGGQILSNANPLPLRYVARVTDPNLMSPLFRKCFGLQLAVDLCKALTGDSTLKEAIQQELRHDLAMARTSDAQSEGDGRLPEDTWLLVRG